MRTYSLSHLSDHVLLRDLAVLVAKDRATSAALLAHLAEVDARKLYLRAGFSSMFAYCVEELHLSEDAASKRIQAARAAREFPALFTALADGRLHLTGLGLLAPRLTPENVDALLAAAAYQTKSAIEQLLAQRFPRTESLPLVQAIPASPPLGNGQLAPAQVGPNGPERVGVGQHAPAHVETPVPRPTATPLASERFALQFTIGKDTHDKLRYVQALLSHRLPSGDLAQVLDRALDALMGQLEKQKFAATPRPRARSRRSTRNPRTIPPHVKRAVWERDKGRCTFVGESGLCCGSRKFLEFDHIEPVARGGQATVEGMRLRCRAHNEEGSSRRWRSSEALSQAGTSGRHAGKNALN